MNELTHLDELGHVRMVDVTDKADTERWALARGTVMMTRKTFELITLGKVTKGNVFETARIAGIQAAKKTWDLIPMCHPLSITSVRIDFTADDQRPAFHIAAEVRVKGPTGVEMEALTAVATAALTIYDMCKSIDKSMVISDIRLEEKTGGKSGHFIRDAHETP